VSIPTSDMEALKLYLVAKAKREAWSDDEEFIAGDYAGGNFDDAYFGGTEDGETLLARHLLETFFGD
jgi:hypothetical protein